MKKLVFILMYLSGLQICAQIENYPPGFTNFIDDYVEDSIGSKAVNHFPYGGVFTPKGTIRALVIYAGFDNDNGQTLDGWPNPDFPNSVPNFVNPVTGEAPEFIYNDVSDFTTYAGTNYRGVSRAFYEFSKGGFYFLGDVLCDPVSGIPVRINVDPTASNPNFPYNATWWNNINLRVMHRMRELYPNFDWSPYDLHANKPDYQTDNSITSPDGKPDYVIIVYRYSGSWVPQPVSGMNSWQGSAGGFSTLSGVWNFNYNGYTFDESGFTFCAGGGGPVHHQGTFMHEIAHSLYSCPHYMGANGVTGYYFYKPSTGWGMMSSVSKNNMSVLAWERWLLGWTDIKSDNYTINSDIQTAADLIPTSGQFSLHDFLQSGDAIRIKINDNQALWIENHKQKSVFDFKPWTGLAPSLEGEKIPKMESGLYMYVESIIPTRTYNGTILSTTFSNGIKPFNAQGNFDYWHSPYAPPKTWDYLWNNWIFTFMRLEENPISGINPLFEMADDYPSPCDIGTTNGIISRSNLGDINTNTFETYQMHRETDGANTLMTYAGWGGVNDEARAVLNRRSDAFQLGDEISMSGIVPVLNHPKYDDNNRINLPFVLNGIKIEVISEDPVTNAITLHISLSDYEVRNGKRWTGNIELYNSSNDQNADLIVKQGVSITINKSGIPNRHILTTNNDFINPTTFTCKNGSYFNQESNSLVEVEDESTLTLESGSKYRIENGAVLRIKTNSNFIMESGSTLEVEDGGSIIIENTSNFKYFGGTVNLIGTNSLLDISGMLKIASNTDFTFIGNGYIRLSNPDVYWNFCNIQCGDNSSITLTGSGQTDKILEIDQEAFYTPKYPDNAYDLTSLTITNGLVDMKSSTAMIGLNGDNTSLILNNVKFTPLSSSVRTTHRGVHIYGQQNISIDNCVFEKGTHGVYGWLTYSYGAPLTVTNCTFTNNQYGIWVHDKQIQAIDCYFSNHLSNGYGLYAEATSFDNNLLDNCSFYNNTYHVKYYNCEGNMLVNNSTLNITPQTAIDASGNHDLSLKCTNITNVSGVPKAGIYLLNGAFLNITNSTTPQSTHNVITGPYAIRLSNARSFNLNNGYSYICPNTVTTYRHIYGTITTGGCPETMPALYNQWYTNLNSLSSSHYNVSRAGCGANTVNGTSTSWYAACSGGGGGESAAGGEISTTSLNENYNNGVNQLQNAAQTGNYAQPFNSFAQVFNVPMPAQNSVPASIWEKSWENMRHCLKQMYFRKELNGVQNTEFGQAVAANNKILLLQQGNYYRKFQLEIEKATLYRMAGDYNTSISLLTQLVNDTSEINREQAEFWFCLVNIEKQIADGNLSPGEIEQARAECPSHEFAETKMLEVTNQITDENNSPFVNSSWLNIVPNPATETSTLIVNNASETPCEVEINDLFGRLIKSIQVQDGYSETIISLNEFAEGLYLASLKKKGQIVAKVMITIVK